MRAVIALILALFISSSVAVDSLAPGGTALGWDFSIVDSNSALYPVTITQTSGGAAYAYISGSGAAAGTTSSSATVPAAPSATNAWTVAFKSNAGIPNSFTFAVKQATTTQQGAFGVVLTVPVGPQVALTVSGAYTGGTAGSETTGSLQTSAAGVTATATTCGSYYIDCGAGVLTLQAYTTAIASRVCTVTVTQIPAVFGGLAYATTLPTGAQAQLATAVTSNSNGSGSPSWCGTLTNSGNTVYLFTQPLATTAAIADINTAQAKLLAAIKAKTAFTGSARLLEESERVLATSYTLVNGYATALPTSTSAGIVAPSTTASASLAANATSQSRVVVIAGLFTTVLAAVFGLAL